MASWPTSPLSKLDISDGTLPTLTIHNSADNAVEGGRIRFVETGATTYLGGYIHYDGSANVLNIGTHNAADQLTSSDINTISLSRGTGNVGIGTTNPSSWNFQVAGTAGGSGAWQTSDVRWKEDINTIAGALDKVSALRGITFTYNREAFPDKRFPPGRQMGLIAQEAEPFVPEVVFTDSEGYKSIAYQNLTALLVNAVKEQQKEIEELRKEVAELKEKIRLK